MDDLERKTMFNPVDNYEAKEIISSDLEKYRIVRSKFFYYCTKFNKDVITFLGTISLFTHWSVRFIIRDSENRLLLALKELIEGAMSSIIN